MSYTAQKPLYTINLSLYMFVAQILDSKTLQVDQNSGKSHMQFELKGKGI